MTILIVDELVKEFRDINSYLDIGGKFHRVDIMRLILQKQNFN